VKLSTGCRVLAAAGILEPGTEPRSLRPGGRLQA
jgi:hypothetical protein